MDPFAVAVNGTAAEKLIVVTSSGAVVDSSASATWKSSDTGVSYRSLAAP